MHQHNKTIEKIVDYLQYFPKCNCQNPYCNECDKWQEIQNLIVELKKTSNFTHIFWQNGPMLGGEKPPKDCKEVLVDWCGSRFVLIKNGSEWFNFYSNYSPDWNNEQTWNQVLRWSLIESD
jgi:hypothetical protein